MTDDLAVLALPLGVLLVRVGEAMHETGMLRAKNSVSSLVRGLADLCIAAIFFWAVGGAFFFAGHGGGGLLWMDPAYLFGRGDEYAGEFVLGMAATLLATGTVGGVLAERSRFFPVCAASAVLAALVVPISAFWVLHGWLAALQFHDFAGASFLHVTGASCAAVGALSVGPRSGKYNRDGSTNGIPGHSVPLALSGVMLMLAGWLPYVLGFVGMSGNSARWGAVGLNVLLAGAAGGLASLLLSHWRYNKPDAHLSFSGLLGGLVAITAGADQMNSMGAVVTGAIAGVVVPAAILALELVWRVDDPTSGIATRGVAAAWGIIAAGLFGPAGHIGQRLTHLGVQATGLLAICALAALISAALFLLLKATMPLRSREADEFDGLDLAEHDIGAYPDFQQTTIKSYHLREA